MVKNVAYSEWCITMNDWNCEFFLELATFINIVYIKLLSRRTNLSMKHILVPLVILTQLGLSNKMEWEKIGSVTKPVIFE